MRRTTPPRSATKIEPSDANANVDGRSRDLPRPATRFSCTCSAVTTSLERRSEKLRCHRRRHATEGNAGSRARRIRRSINDASSSVCVPVLRLGRTALQSNPASRSTSPLQVAPRQDRARCHRRREQIATTRLRWRRRPLAPAETIAGHDAHVSRRRTPGSGSQALPVATCDQEAQRDDNMKARAHHSHDSPRWRALR